MSWVELNRIVSEEIVRDDDTRRRVAASGRPLRSHATGMSDDDLLAKLDARFPMTQSLFNWCQDLEMALQNGGEHDPEMRTARLG